MMEILYNWPKALPAKSHWPTRLIPFLLLLIPLGASLPCIWLLFSDVWIQIFGTLFVLRYTRLFVHLLGSFLYRPFSPSPYPNFTRGDVTVVLPTIDPRGPHFEECVRSILANHPAFILVVTVGDVLKQECINVIQELVANGSHTRISVAALSEPSKRRQIAHAMPNVTTAITVLADDHVFWPVSFLPEVLAPFDDDNVGVVATKKRVRRTAPGIWSWESIVNFIACNYLQRHNWELRTSSAIDGGVFVVSGRTAAYRTEFLNDTDLLQKFCHEKFFFGLLGGDGLGPDDDNFLTREAIKKKWRIFFQDSDDATIETTLGEWPKFKDQLMRWARTTVRSNPVMLRDPIFLFRYPWSAFVVYWAALFNFALLWDAALIFTLFMSKYGGMVDIALLLIFMFWSKVIKLIPHFLKYPQDFPLMVCQIVFGYLHSFIKLWALITFWDCGWSGRDLEGVGQVELDTRFTWINPMAHQWGH
ncbi:hypothetical protein NW752_003147 [Fusarium irregulare]|uniref:Capsule polysaccharide synthase n=1 Tax=Fusarium irregulare TaxID=2494466 RepID=A0A9W8UFQ2_9HYPO|nr:hypothetical protein NW766_000818 [Fusarium irregulare]KAJ4025673.1 hypothetical protein NW752_003147 [Fusarium irregulare]